MYLDRRRMFLNLDSESIEMKKAGPATSAQEFEANGAEHHSITRPDIGCCGSSTDITKREP